ncbi:MAG: PAS domain S-box protein [Bacteroidota bacterium]
MTPNVTLRRHLITISRVMVFTTIIVATLVVVGSIFSFQLLQKITPYGITMNPMAAIEYMVLGFCFLGIFSNKNFTGKEWISNLLLISNILICCTVLFSFLTRIDIGLDKLLAKVEIRELRINRMSQFTAICLLLNSIAVYLLKTRSPYRIIVAQYIALTVGFLGSFLLLGFLFRSFNVIYVYTTSPTAFFAVICHLFMAFAIFFAYPDKGLGLELTKTKIGSKTVIIFSPIITVLPIIFFWVHLKLPFASTVEGVVVGILLFSVLSFIIVFVDLRNINKVIDERLQLEAIVENNLQQLQHLSGLVNMSNDAIITCDTAMVINGWNKGAEKIYGYTAEEAIGNKLYKLIDEPILKPEEYNLKLETLFNKGEINHELVQRTKSGKLIHVSHSAIVNKDNEGTIIGMISVGKEITTLVEAENKLAELNHSLEEKIEEKTAELAGLYDRISDGVAVLDNEWRYTYMNKTCLNLIASLYGVTECVIGKNTWEAFPHLLNTEAEKAYRLAVADQITVRKLFYSSKANIWMEQTLYPSDKGLTIFFRDITLQKVAEEKQKQLELRFKQIAETAQEGIMVRDEKGIIVFVNDFLANLFKMKKEDLIGFPVLKFFDATHQKTIEGYYENRKQGIAESYELEVALPNGSSKILYVSSSPLIENDVHVGALSMISDITEKKNNEKSLIKINKLYDTLSRVTKLLVNLTTRENLLEEACKIIVEYSSDLHLVWIGEHIADVKEVKNVSAFGQAKDYLNNLNIRTDDSAYAQGPTGTAIKTGKRYICNDYFSDPNTIPWRETAKQYGFFASAIFVINVNNSKWGALNVYATVKNYFQEEEIILFEKIADVISIGLQKLEDEIVKTNYINELKAAKEEWERTFNAIPDYIAIIDTNHKIVRANQSMATLVNLNTDSIAGKQCFSLVHGTDCPIDNCPHSALLLDGKAHLYSLYEEKFSAYLDVSTSPIYDKEGKLTGSVHIARDVSEKKKTELKIKQLAEINEFSTAYVGMANLEGKMLYFNKAAMKALDIDTEEKLSKYTIIDFRSKEDTDFLNNVILPEIYKKGVWFGENSWTSRKGKKIPLIQGVILHRNEKGEPDYISTTAIDISELKNKEEELRSLTQNLLTAREEERKSIAKELHDELGQNLTALKLDVTWIMGHIDSDNAQLNNRLQQFKDITEDTVSTSRRLYNSLYPQMLDDVGLSGAITWHANTYLKKAGIDFELQTGIDGVLLPELHDIWLVLYRVYQECMTNVLRYSKANSVIAELYNDDKEITMIIQDDGIGFDIDKVDTKLHHGLLGIRERIYALKGTITIDSAIGKGTRTTAIIPIP